ncbi:MAG TPA: nickel ABC transporter permease [Anaerolineae bacterium]|nr:nickel ABC transporter permease [Anaerolineae bacterium]
MGRYIAYRLILTIFVLLGVSLVVFFMIRLIPGDPAQLLADQWATKEDIEQLRRDMGLDRPITVQYLIFMDRVLHGDLGNSIITKVPVTSEIAARFPYTLTLAVIGTVIAVVIGTLAGTVSAVKPFSIFDNTAMILSLLGVSTPAFWLGLMFMLVFSVRLGWLPAMGAATPKHLILPSLTLGLLTAGVIARQSRSSMLQTLQEDYIVTARSKGLRERVVVYRHALKNALIPVVTIVGLQFGHLLGGAVLVESVFSWPGMGRLLVDAIFTRDYPIIQGAVLMFAMVFALVNLGVDLLYGLLDPRIGYE